MNRRGLAYLLIGGGIFVVLMVILTYFQASEAATFPSASDLGVPGPFQSTGTAFKTTWETIVAVAGVIFLVIILIGGVMYLISAGEEQNQTRAKNLIRDGIIGIALVALAWPIGLAVLNVLGLSSNLGLSGGSNPTLGTPGDPVGLTEPSPISSGGGGSTTPAPSGSATKNRVNISIKYSDGFDFQTTNYVYNLWEVTDNSGAFSDSYRQIGKGRITSNTTTFNQTLDPNKTYLLGTGSTNDPSTQRFTEFKGSDENVILEVLPNDPTGAPVGGPSLQLPT